MAIGEQCFFTPLQNNLGEQCFFTPLQNKLPSLCACFRLFQLVLILSLAGTLTFLTNHFHIFLHSLQACVGWAIDCQDNFSGICSPIHFSLFSLPCDSVWSLVLIALWVTVRLFRLTISVKHITIYISLKLYSQVLRELFNFCECNVSGLASWAQLRAAAGTAMRSVRDVEPGQMAAPAGRLQQTAMRCAPARSRR